MTVRGTENYVYFMDKRLGSGATGVVYFGRHKVSKRDGDLLLQRMIWLESKDISLN